jgi:serine protease Do
MRRVRRLWLIAIGIFLLGGLAALGWQTFRGDHLEASSVVTPPNAAIEMQDSFITVARGVRPAVVNITSRKTVGATDMGDEALPGQFETPFGPEFPGLRLPMPGPREVQGTGSGFIVRSDGYILTNDHVVAGADRVTARLADGREFTGTVMRDPRSDLALVKIPADNLPTLNLSDSSQAQVGQWAIAFGSPLGLQNTMTVGIVSATGRQEAIGRAGEGRFYPSLIQTDAAINPGNSGGPLVDIYGNVIGVNVAIASPSGGNVGIGFAIPAGTARYVMDQLITKGTVVRGFLGFVPEDLSPGDRQRYGAQEGALVTAVTDNSPAMKAGLQVEDVVIRFNGQPVRDSVSLRDLVARTAPGSEVEIVVMRGGHEQTLTATVGSAPGEQAAQAPAQPQQGKLGVEVADMTPEIARRLNLPSDTGGVVVASVRPGSPAEEAGLRPGDILLRVNGRTIAAAADVGSSVEALKPGEEASIIVRRGDARILLRATMR